MPGKLLVSTGDASDADGFAAVAIYARSGADLLFFMNLPAVYRRAAGGKSPRVSQGVQAGRRSHRAFLCRGSGRMFGPQ